eukprot:568845-Prymnesium_polylepis.1
MHRLNLSTTRVKRSVRRGGRCSCGPGSTGCPAGGTGGGGDGGLPALRLTGAGGFPARGHVR